MREKLDIQVTAEELASYGLNPSDYGLELEPKPKPAFLAHRIGVDVEHELTYRPLAAILIEMEA